MLTTSQIREIIAAELEPVRIEQALIVDRLNAINQRLADLSRRVEVISRRIDVTNDRITIANDLITSATCHVVCKHM